MTLVSQTRKTNGTPGPKVSIGMPVHNGEKSIRKALDSLLAQTFSDFELIISDNCSTDATESICRQYASKDRRINYVRRNSNRGAHANFKYVLDAAAGEYFMWAAGDDCWGHHFIRDNLVFLEEHLDFIGSISQARCFNDKKTTEAGTTTIDSDSKFNRVVEFIKYPGYNSRFYSLFRRSDIKVAFDAAGAMCIGHDWIVIAHALTRGKLNCLHGSPQFFKSAGESANLVHLINTTRSRSVEKLLPLYILGKHLYNIGCFSDKALPTAWYYTIHNLRTAAAYWLCKFRLSS